MSLVFLILTISLVGLIPVQGQDIQCSKDTKTFDTYMTDYFLLAAPTRKFPTNPAELKKFCKENPIHGSTIKAYGNKCFDKLLRRLTSLGVYSVQKTNANMCRSKRRSAELMEMGKCGNAANKDNKRCWANWMKSSNGISLVTDRKTRIPLVCCLTYTMKNCFAQSYEKNKKNCNQKAKEGMENLFGGYLIDTLKLMCGDYTEDNDKCDKIIDKLPSGNSKSTVNSPIALLMAIFDGIEEDAV